MSTLKVAEGLRELERLRDNALLLLIVAHLRVALPVGQASAKELEQTLVRTHGEREVLAERVALEAVVGEDPAEVRVVGEEDAVHVYAIASERRAPGVHNMVHTPSLALVPAGKSISWGCSDSCSGFHASRPACTDPRVQPDLPTSLPAASPTRPIWATRNT
mgnify:CR=1 FL=1